MEAVAVAGGEGAFQSWAVQGSDTLLRPIAILSAENRGIERSEVEDQLMINKGL